MLKNRLLILSAATIAIIVMASSIPTLHAQSGDYLHIYLWNNMNEERYADARIRIYEGAQPSTIDGETLWRNLVYDSDIDLNGITTSSVSWFVRANDTHTIRATSPAWGGEVTELVTGYGDVELHFDEATEPSTIPDEVIEEPTESEEPTASPEAEPDNNTKDYSTEILLGLAIAVAAIAITLIVYRMNKKKNQNSSANSQPLT